ncbi:MAG TPA: cytosine permease [Jatrophihabitans sp.]|jgi:purine-cytosine permease-like protein|uniref:purine-cytosine permease family protein n=1 Tax=Jatrophihabitans sp. TaxID=1932789 RepID=UPI002DFFFBD4|nr:cytosine permease [Jatrophihabitans sp.]
MTTTPLIPVDDPNRDYGDRIAAVEPGGVEVIPLDERHGSPRQMLWTWTSPNMEFATIGVGILGVLYWGLTFWQTVAAIAIGTAAGSLTQGILSTWGPKDGLCQMVLSRTGFGFLGNILPAGLNAIIAGIGWFAVNSISGALALHVLITGLPSQLCLLIVVLAQLGIAYFGHNLVHAFERYAFPVLTVIFVIAAVWVLGKSHPGVSPFTVNFPPPTLGGFLLMTGAAFGYAAGWNPYASDYTRYLEPTVKPIKVALYSGLGVFISCVVLEVAGAAAVTTLTPAQAGKTTIGPAIVTDLLPTWLGKLTLLAIFLGAICANVLNIYSGSLSFMALGVKLPLHVARAIVAVVLGLIGYAVAAHYLKDPSSYENFLLIIAYWIGPWLAVVFIDRWSRRDPAEIIAVAENPKHRNWAGPISMAIGGGIAIWLFANQYPKYVGPIPTHHPAFGDITFEVGFVLTGLLYLVLRAVLKPTPAPTASAAPEAVDAG